MAVVDGKAILRKNDCYKKYQKMTPKGIVVHSTGANNPYLKRYLAPDDGIIGKNSYGNDWNRSGLDVAVHAFIGKDKNGKVKCYQTLPYNICCWGVGSGSKGSYNYNPAYIQFEICEDDLTDKKYCTETYNKAVDFCVYLCKAYGINVNNIVGHYEAHKKGYGSNHADPQHWWKKHGYSMDGFRKAVKSKLTNSAKEEPKKPAPTKPTTTTFKSYLVRITSDNGVNIRKGPGTNYAITGTIAKGGAYTIVEEKTGQGAKKWGKLKSGAGWIALDYTKKI